MRTQLIKGIASVTGLWVLALFIGAGAVYWSNNAAQPNELRWDTYWETMASIAYGFGIVGSMVVAFFLVAAAIFTTCLVVARELQ